MLPLSPNEWANPHLQDSPQCLGLCLLCWKIPRSLSDHAGRIWALFAIHYKGEKQILSRIRRSILLIGKTFSVFSHLSQKGVWLLGLPISPQRSDTSQTKLMADRKNWLVSENSFSDEVSRLRGLTRKVTKAGCRLHRWMQRREAEGRWGQESTHAWLTFLVTGVSTPFWARGLLWACELWNNLHWVRGQSSGSEIGQGSKWEAGVFSVDSISDTCRTPAGVMGKCWQKVELFVFSLKTNKLTNKNKNKKTSSSCPPKSQKSEKYDQILALNLLL